MKHFNAKSAGYYGSYPRLASSRLFVSATLASGFSRVKFSSRLDSPSEPPQQRGGPQKKRKKAHVSASSVLFNQKIRCTKLLKKKVSLKSLVHWNPEWLPPPLDTLLLMFGFTAEAKWEMGAGLVFWQYECLMTSTWNSWNSPTKDSVGHLYSFSHSLISSLALQHICSVLHISMMM